MARYFDSGEDISRCPRAQRGLLIFPKYTQIFIWLGKKGPERFPGLFCFEERDDRGEDSENAVRKVGGTFSYIQRAFLST